MRVMGSKGTALAVFPRACAAGVGGGAFMGEPAALGECAAEWEREDARLGCLEVMRCTLRVALARRSRSLVTTRSSVFRRARSRSSACACCSISWTLRTKAVARSSALVNSERATPPRLFCALPISTKATFSAKYRVDMVSLFESIPGATWANIITLPRRSSASCSIIVSLLLRYGTCRCFCCRAMMTSPRADSDRLMCCASLSRSPSASDLATRSLPAKSMRCMQLYEVRDTEYRERGLVRAVRKMLTRECERELRSFILVAKVARAFCAVPITRKMSSGVATLTCSASGTHDRPRSLRCTSSLEL
mmetsp:Transcript_46389/g.88563  ORF Transcript_46389/g.88563 Transcript_46389/m.88563 type:complete len:307 (+) Transcript_46389:88-1008(+)